MPAQFKEVVVTADLFNVQDVRPDLRQGDFHRTLRRGIFAAQPRRLIRFWQRLAIEFAVGGQRQCLQAHVSGRHQGLRQLCLQMTAQILDLNVQAFGKPRQQLAVAYQHPCGVFARLDLNAQAGLYFSASHDQRAARRELVNLRAGWRGGRWTASLWARNLFNERYAVDGFYFGDEPPDFPAKLYLQNGDPRQVGATLSYDLGDR